MKTRNLAIVALLPALLFSCLTDNKLTKIDPYHVFHDNSSKVWMINHCYKDGKDISPISRRYKEIITFYKSGNCYVQRMNTFGDEAGKKGNFTVNGEKRQFWIDYPNESWNFKLKMFSNRKIILEPNDGKFLYTLELIPVPEP